MNVQFPAAGTFCVLILSLTFLAHPNFPIFELIVCLYHHALHDHFIVFVIIMHFS